MAAAARPRAPLLMVVGALTATRDGAFVPASVPSVEPVDADGLDVVVSEPRLRLDPTVAGEIDERWPREPEEDAVAPGRYPVVGVVLLGTRPDHLRVASPARRLASLASLLDTSTRPARAADVEAIGRLDTHTEVVRALGYETDELIDILGALAR